MSDPLAIVDGVEMEPWQQEVFYATHQAHEEGRTELRYVQGRRGGFWTFVAPEPADPEENPHE